MDASPMMSFVMAFLLSGGTGADLLQFVPSDAYWKAQKVEVSVDAMILALGRPGDAAEVADLVTQLGDKQFKVRAAARAKLAAMGPSVLPLLAKAAEKAGDDPEVTTTLKELRAELGGKGAASAVRRLMAIRTLGDLKDAKAVAELKKLLDSKTAFEAEYAARAIAAIEGKPFKTPDAAEAIRKDVWLLPKNCAIVGQACLPDLGIKGMDDLVGQLGDLLPKEAKDAMVAQVAAQLMQAADRVGNIRFTGGTMGVADNVGNRAGFAVFIIHGLYDRVAMAGVIKELAGRPGREMATEKIGDCEVLFPDREAAIMMPSNEQFAIVVGPGREQLPLKELADAFKAGKGGLGDNAEMAKLIKSVDPTANAWAIAQITDAYRAIPDPDVVKLIGPFKTIVATAKIGKDVVDVSLKATGDKDKAEAVAAAVEFANKGLAEGKQELAREVGRMPMLKPIADFMDSIKIAADGANATASAQYKGSLIKAAFTPVLMFQREMGRMEEMQRRQMEQRPVPNDPLGPDN